MGPSGAVVLCISRYSSKCFKTWGKIKDWFFMFMFWNRLFYHKKTDRWKVSIMLWNTSFQVAFFVCLSGDNRGWLQAGFIIQPIWHLVYPERQTYSVSASPVGWRLWLATDVLNYWSGWLLLILLSYYWFTAGVLVGSVVFECCVLGIPSLLRSGDSKIPWAE